MDFEDTNFIIVLITLQATAVAAAIIIYCGCCRQNQASKKKKKIKRASDGDHDVVIDLESGNVGNVRGDSGARQSKNKKPISHTHTHSHHVDDETSPLLKKEKSNSTAVT